MEVERKIKVFNQENICKPIKKTYNVEYKKLPSQSKTLDITKNGNYQVTPDCGYTLNKADIKVNVEQTTTTPAVTKESTEQIADYTYWQKEVGRAGAKVILSDSVPNKILTEVFYYAKYPLEIGKIKSMGDIINKERTIDFEIFLKKGTNYVYIIYNNVFDAANISTINEFVKSIQISDCTCRLSNTPHRMRHGNVMDDVIIEANEEGIYNGFLIIHDHIENKVKPRIRFCKSVAGVLYNIEFPSYVTYDELANGDYGNIDKINFKNIIVYTTNPQSYDWKIKKVNISDGVYLKYHRTYLNKVDNSIVRTKKPIDYIPDLTIKRQIYDYTNNKCFFSLKFSINKPDPQSITQQFINDIYSIFGLCNIEIYCKKHKSVLYKDNQGKYKHQPIGKSMEYSSQIEEIFKEMNNSLIDKNSFQFYIKNKFGSRNPTAFYMKIRIFNNNSNYYYYRLKFDIDFQNYICNLSSIIFEKIKNNTIQKY